MEAMTFNNPLETFALRRTNNINFFTFSENVNSYVISKCFFEREVAEFFYKFFGGSIRLSEVIFFGSESMLFLFVAESQLNGVVSVGFERFYLRYNSGTGFDNGARGLLTIGTEDAGHPDLFANNAFHLLLFAPRRLKRQCSTQ